MLRAPALRAAIALGIGGLGFALGNLLLARLLIPREFGAVALVLSLIQVGGAVGAFGLPVLIVRYEWSPHRVLLGPAILPAAAAAALTSVSATSLYGMSLGLASLLGLIVLLAALGRVAGAFYQSRQAWGTSLLLNQAHNWILLGSAGLVWLLNEPYAMTVIGLMFCSYLAAALVGWTGAAKTATGVSAPQLDRSELAAAAAHVIATNAFFQIDRLLIGKLLTLEDVASYAAIAALAGSAFRMLQVGAGYTLTPRLKKCADRRQARSVLRGEALLMSAVSLITGILLLVLCPWLFRTFLPDYRFAEGLLFAIVITGFVRIWQSLAAAVVTALGTAASMRLLSICGWSALFVAGLGALVGSRFSLTATVYGIGGGWLAYAVSASFLGWRTLRS